ncbi:MAG: alpha/beta fold hydrolase [Pseudomonadota bacterium]
MQTTYRIPGMVLRDHTFELPLDYANPVQTIQVYAREVAAPGKEDTNQPYLVYFQGGPGSGAPRPVDASGWIGRALQDYRVLLLDQRGTGRSTPVTAQTLAGFGSAQAQADYLMHFRADNIVRDADAIRQQLIGASRWSILGQSYGGFCAMRYLSAAPEGLKEVLITGGIPSLTRPVDDVYRATYRRVVDKNRLYYQRYPDDASRVRQIVDHLLHNDVYLPSGARLDAQRFLQLGLQFGMSGGFEAVHYLLEEAFVTGADGRVVMNWNFLFHLEQMQTFETNPIYSLLHEACYTQGAASRWSAQRLLAEFPEFALERAGPVLFTGEMIYPWMFDAYAQLQPLKAAADILAATAEWPQLYDAERLKQNTVPVAAAVYYDDMYVHREFSEETAASVPNMKLWVTNEHEHNGLRADGAAVLGRLLAMVRGEI